MSEEPNGTEKPIDVPVVNPQQNETPSPEPKSQDLGRRLRELLAIPERDRSDAVWDEIVSLEIQLAPGNRAPSAQADGGRRQEPGRQQDSGRRQEQGRRQEPRSDAKPAKRFFKRPKRG
jgi:hypothetical protein